MRWISALPMFSKVDWTDFKYAAGTVEHSMIVAFVGSAWNVREVAF